MKAIYLGNPYYIVDEDVGSCVLEPAEGTIDERIYVDFGEPTLIIDPTDGEWEAALHSLLPANYTGDNLLDTIFTLIELMPGGRGA